ncbi:MAG: hypothetical protein IT532_12425 [Burkholderiales bacterium]|nr:hypothetical protein [Burkholderiales bacterium]
MRPLPALAALAAVLSLGACATPEKMTAEAVQCGTREVSIIPSRFSRMGSRTAWCASCRGTVYRCATNAQRTRTECVPSREGDGCGG